MIPKFLEKNSVEAAPLLLGWKLIVKTAEGIMSGYIVETEAYDMGDPASHSYRGMTPRTAPMFEAAGTIYVYFTYGMHFCMNIVTGPVGHGAAVLIRALEPVDGIELMQYKRNVVGLKNLTNGPAKLTQALGVNRQMNGTNLQAGPIFLEKGIKPKQITQTTRIGISRAQEAPWRFYITDNKFVSKQ